VGVTTSKVDRKKEHRAGTNRGGGKRGRNERGEDGRHTVRQRCPGILAHGWGKKGFTVPRAALALAKIPEVGEGPSEQG